MNRGGGFWVIVLFAAAIGLCAWQVRRKDVRHSLAQVAYTLHCAACTNVVQLTTAELNGMIERGEATSPAQQMRQFKCPRCGKIELIMDAGVPHASR